MCFETYIILYVINKPFIVYFVVITPRPLWEPLRGESPQCFAFFLKHGVEVLLQEEGNKSQ